MQILKNLKTNSIHKYKRMNNMNSKKILIEKKVELHACHRDFHKGRRFGFIVTAFLLSS